MARLALEAAGFEVKAYTAADTALESMRTAPPDLALMDVDMPGRDGPETLAAMRAEPGTREVPVIFMTARAGAEERARLERLGALGVIPKPFDVKALPSQVRGLWRER